MYKAMEQSGLEKVWVVRVRVCVCVLVCVCAHVCNVHTIDENPPWKSMNKLHRKGNAIKLCKEKKVKKCVPAPRSTQLKIWWSIMIWLDMNAKNGATNLTKLVNAFFKYNNKN